MLDLDQRDNLARLYRLFVMVPAGRTTLRRALKDSILRRGLEINHIYEDEAAQSNMVVADDPKGKGKARSTAAPADIASRWVEDVLNLKDKFDQFWKHCFDGDREFETSCNEVCGIPFFWGLSLTTDRPSRLSSIVTSKQPNIFHYSLTRI